MLFWIPLWLKSGVKKLKTPTKGVYKKVFDKKRKTKEKKKVIQRKKRKIKEKT